MFILVDCHGSYEAYQLGSLYLYFLFYWIFIVIMYRRFVHDMLHFGENVFYFIGFPLLLFGQFNFA